MEIDILMAIQKLHTPFLDFLLSRITALGDLGFIWFLAGILLLCIKKYRKQGFLLLLSLLAAFLFGNLLLKNLVQRDRPCWQYPEIELLIKNPWDYSFPSGHSMVGFAAAMSLWLTNKKWGVAALILAAVIAFSRLYLFVHWPTDVLFSVISGILIAVFIFRAAENLEKRKGKKADENV